jgi:hypothetical protein
MRAATTFRPSLRATKILTFVVLLKASVRAAAAAAASFDSMRAATADRPSDRDNQAPVMPMDRSVVLVMACMTVSAAWPHAWLASLGSMRTATAERPCASDRKAFESSVLLWPG